MEEYKQKLLEKLRNHIGFIQKKVLEKAEVVKQLGNKSVNEIRSMPAADKAVYADMKKRYDNRVNELDHLYKIPYFMKCVVTDGAIKEEKTFYIAKHQLSEESIYSWVSPIAGMRFDAPGEVSYKLPSGLMKKLILESKEQYMIVDGKVIFFALEDGSKPRELIYQENFTVKKAGFMLPEIVAQMEKAQDQVIRASHIGPLVISGPAGSGKTTLALHRVAYLTQAPDTAHLYPAKSIIVFVQDNGTKEYFSHLLPELGIHDILITTFSEWAFKMLGFGDGFEYIHRYGETEEEKDLYEYEKIKALRATVVPAHAKDPFIVLAVIYKKSFSKNSLKLFDEQKKSKKFDRFDITLLLQAHVQKYKEFSIHREYHSFVGDTLRKKTEKTLIEYSLVVMDEFQNYLPEQLLLVKSALNEKTQSMLYVGDMAQQVQLGTIQKWENIGEEIVPERNIRLNKVYRNTKNILAFIKTLGYRIEIPEGLKDGPVVVEKITANTEEEIEYIRNAIKEYKQGTVGILAKDESYLVPFKEAFGGNSKVHVLTMHESQGVEFDLVCIVGVHSDMFEVVSHQDALPEHIQERKRMQKDLLYVALTRAINELHILGTERLGNINSQS